MIKVSGKNCYTTESHSQPFRVLQIEMKSEIENGLFCFVVAHDCFVCAKQCELRTQTKAIRCDGRAAFTEGSPDKYRKHT